MLSYCTNVHPAENLDGILAQFDTYAVPVRTALGWDRLGVGLWLPAKVAAGLAADAASRRKLVTELTARGLAVETLNAFPYRDFHGAVVKHGVYQPRWSHADRLRYTLDCVTVLADLLPPDASHGSISTLPLGWRTPWGPADDLRARAAFEEVTQALRTTYDQRGKPIKLAVEPEPGCVLDTVDDAVGWLSGQVDPAFVGLCLDTCHLAVSFADPAAAVSRIYRSGLSVVKIQASAALHVQRPDSERARAALARFAEPRYLHQVRERSPTGQVLAADDLPQGLTDLPADGPWRVHFHVPLHWGSTSGPDALGHGLTGTSNVVSDCLTAVAREVRSPQDFPHIEVETYTWNVLPRDGARRERHELITGIAEELRWTRDRLTEQSPGRQGAHR
ncbi:MAG: metabolite traffic protein EboE [Actinophytocola sp.]|nr:metabolite traffic protein EboE [Actinophytocola sp.]